MGTLTLSPSPIPPREALSLCPGNPPEIPGILQSPVLTREADHGKGGMWSFQDGRRGPSEGLQPVLLKDKHSPRANAPDEKGERNHYLQLEMGGIRRVECIPQLFKT